MNAPLRRVAVGVLVLFGLMLLSTNYLQVVKASDYSDRPGNVRVTEREYAHERGAILVGDDQLVARSKKTSDRLEYLRIYPGGPLYAPVTGFYSLIYGKTGIEAALDDVLSGEDSRLFVRRVSDLVTGRIPQGGAVKLTIDPRAQQAAYDALGNRRGAVVALDPRTGAVLAMVSRPSYDPSVLSSHNPKAIRAAHKSLLADPANPLLNRALQQSYPPGSLFKIVTSAAALSTGRYRPDTEIPAPDKLKLPGVRDPLQNFGGEHCSSTGKQTLADALRISCNTAFADLGLALGQDAIRAQAEKLGFNEGLRIPLAAAASQFPDGLDKPATAQSAIGQRDVQVTPLQAAMIAAAVANHGELMKPYLVAQVLSPDFSQLEGAHPERLSQAMSPTVAAELTQMMLGVVERGTGTAAKIPGIAVAGKTGTAQHAKGAAPHAWFTCFAPADKPTVAVAVVVEDGGAAGSDATGGKVAAPIARAVLEALLK